MELQVENYGLLVELFKCEEEIPPINEGLEWSRKENLRAAIHNCNKTLEEINNKIEGLKCGLKEK